MYIHHTNRFLFQTASKGFVFVGSFMSDSSYSNIYVEFYILKLKMTFYFHFIKFIHFIFRNKTIYKHKLMHILKLIYFYLKQSCIIALQ